MFYLHVCLCATEGIGSPGTGIIDGCETPCGHWKLDSGPLKEQVLLIPKSHLQPLIFFFLCVCVWMPMHVCLCLFIEVVGQPQALLVRQHLGFGTVFYLAWYSPFRLGWLVFRPQGSFACSVLAIQVCVTTSFGLFPSLGSWD